jgi:transketolase
MTEADVKCVNAVRLLAADMIQKAKSGHPGIAMGAAAAAYGLWAGNMRHNPASPDWANRDRFVLSSGHGSALLYSLLHLFGYGLTIEDLKRFRQFGSLTPGHPEYRHTEGVEITTGPLGQGVASAVGMAMAESHLSAVFNKPGLPLVDHYTFALCGDGCLMEGISGEACSLAGTLGLGKLTVLYDSNNITIEGSTDIAFTENVAERYKAYGWHVLRVEDGNDLSAIGNAIEAAKAVKDKPSLIEIKTVIGFGSPGKAGKAAAHGEPLGEAELRLTKEALGFDPDADFYVPPEAEERLAEVRAALADYETEWNRTAALYRAGHPADWAKWEDWLNGGIPDLLADEDFWTYEGDLATRLSSELILNKLAGRVPNLFGGSADLAPSTKAVMKGAGDFAKAAPEGANLHFGVREHAMAAIANGIAVHGGLRPYVAGFFVFSDYMKPALRLSALMGLPVVSVLTHDSIGVGEDGPTHQPIEQLAMLRSIPNFAVFRPCDTRETAAAWYAAVTRRQPAAIVLTRQTCPLLDGTGRDALKGAYVLRREEGLVPQVILIGSGSETALCVKARGILKEKGVDARVVSMPSWELFEEQTDEYKESVLPKAVRKRVAAEALSGFGWERYTGLDGAVVCMNGFGASGKFDILMDKFGITAEAVAGAALKL